MEPPQLTSLLHLIGSTNQKSELEATDDLEGEQETTLGNQVGPDPEGAHISQLQDSLLQASKGVTEGTDASYHR